MQVTLYMITFDRGPDTTEGNEAIMIGTGFEAFDDDAEIPPEALRFATTLLVRSDRPEAVLESVRAWWTEQASGVLEIELMADDERLLSEGMRRSASELGPGEWSFRNHYVAFKAGSPEALADAREFLRDSAMRTQ